MNHANAVYEPSAHAEHQHRNGAPANARKNALIVLGVTIIAVIGWYVEILLFFSYAQEHWHDLWFKVLAVTFPFLPSIAVYCALVAAAKWRRSTSVYIAALFAAVIAAAVLSAYMGDSMLKAHPKIVAYSIASILTLFVVVPIWYGAYRFSQSKFITPIQSAEASPSQQHPPADPHAQASAVIARAAKLLINDGSDRNRGIWIIGCRRPEKSMLLTRIPETMRPVPAAIYLQIVNRTGATLTIHSFNVEYESRPGEWKATADLAVGSDVYSPVVMIREFNPAPINQIGRTVSHDFGHQVVHKNIPSGNTASGWLFLNAPENLSGKKLRFHMWDTSGIEFTPQIDEQPTPMSNQDCINSLNFGAFSDDISSVKVEIPWSVNAAPTTAATTQASSSDHPPDRESLERLTTVSQLIDAIDSCARWIDKAILVGDKPDARAEVHACYLSETAQRLGVEVPGPMPSRGALLSDEQKWLIGLKNVAMNEMSQRRQSRRVSIRASCVMPKEIMNATWFMFTAARGCVALYPIETALFLHITNRSTEPVAIAEYSIECRTKGGMWETLPSFSIPRSGKLVGALNIQKAMTFEIVDPMLHMAVSDGSLSPNETISGWSILGQVEHNLTKKFRMRIRDEKGHEFTEEISLPLDVRSQPSPESCMRFHVSETTIDLSQIPVKRYFKFR